jgi:hypothetical protein
VITPNGWNCSILANGLAGDNIKQMEGNPSSGTANDLIS